ncbi:DUF2256 domain-containing protein [Falsiroseomonas sp. HW251]|uniref:DUF2256 domain-containing protein n=1 Tax=Falsiroseomonas sp. HW251 TaxID=3390998 RepID=UPI003D31FE09
MAHRKPNLPEKLCAACGRPFAWRKKWARDWEHVRYCSDACRTGRHGAAREMPASPLDPARKRG